MKAEEDMQPHERSELEHVEEVGFYWVVGMIAVSVVGFAIMLFLAFQALRGVGAILGGP